MEFCEYIEKKKELQSHILEFIEDSSSNEYDFSQLIQYIESQQIQKNKNELKQFLNLISSISNNHYRQQGLIKKIENIIQYFTENIKQILSNSEIFDIFHENKKILYFLFNQEIINIDEYIFNKILEKDEQFQFFFIPEMKKLEGSEERIKLIEEKILTANEHAFQNYDENRQIGENDSYICLLIRQDLIEEFIIFINKNGISFNSTIKPSIFETNLFLQKRNPTLIEYATFHGSIRIIQYLQSNEVSLTESLWLYAIHSNNAEIISLLEQDKIEPIDKSFLKVFLESIKCHHNEIAEFIQNNLLKVKDPIKVVDYSFHYFNYSYFPDNFEQNDAFFYFCKYDYSNIVDLILATKKNEIEAAINQSKNPFKYAIDCDKMYIVYYLLLKETKIKKSFFNECNNLRKIVIPSNITMIEDNSFSECSSLSDIIIPSTVKSIGDRAFSYCSSLQKIRIPSSMTMIKNGTFLSCKSLKKIFIPSSILTIDQRVFHGCSGLKQIIIPSSVTSIGKYCFNSCFGLKKALIYSSSITTINDYTFNRCFELEKVLLPSSIKEIGNYAFNECARLNNVELPSSVISIGNNAFSACSLLDHITLPSSLVSIGDGSFRSCTSLTQVNFPSTLKEIGISSFNRCSLLAQISFPLSEITIDRFCFGECSVTHIEIPIINIINSSVFDQCNSLISVGIPLATKIMRGAFFECTSLTQITMPNVKEIEENAFSGCSSLVKLDIPVAVTIGPNAFKDCSSLAEIDAPAISSIGENAFYRCSSLKELCFPFIKFIGEKAFYECNSLTQVSVCSRTYTLAANAFPSKTKIVEIDG